MTFGHSSFDNQSFNAGTYDPVVFVNGVADGGEAKSKNFENYYTMWQDGQRRADVQPFKELEISGTKDTNYHWSSGQNGTRLDLENSYTTVKCGNLEFVLNDGWTMEVYIKTGNADYFNDNLSSSAKKLNTLDTGGMRDGDSKLYAIMVGGDKLSLDICSDYSGTKNFYLTTYGTSVGDGDEADMDDWAIVDIQNISYKGASSDGDNSGDGSGDGSGDDATNGSGDEVATDEGPNWILYGGVAIAAIFLLKK